jgi:nicotinate-nucleotide adenylyltransferase
MVANDPWQKTGTRLLSAASARLAMVSAAVEGLDGLEASGLEIDRGGVTYTIDTLQVLRSAAPDQQLFLIVGSDAATTLHTWHRYEELRDLATLVIVDRDGHSDAEPPAGWSAERVSIPRLDISSSELRDRVRCGQPLEPFLEASVIEEIRSRGLYGSDDS